MISISINNFLEQKEFSIWTIFLFLSVEIMGVLYINFSSPYISTSYYTNLSIIEFSEFWLRLWYPFFVFVFIISHFKIKKVE